MLAALIGLDQLSKFLTKLSLPYNHGTTIDIFPWPNYNLFFVLKWPRELSIIISIVLISGLFYLTMKSKPSLLDDRTIPRAPIILIICGGLSNLFDRILYGGVIDIFHIGSFSLNLADLMIVAGLIWLIFSLFKYKKIAS